TVRRGGGRTVGRFTQDLVTRRDAPPGVVAGVLIARRRGRIGRHLGQDHGNDWRRGPGVGVRLRRQDRVRVLAVLRRRHVARLGGGGGRGGLPTRLGRGRDQHGRRTGEEHGNGQFSEFVTHGSPAFAHHSAWYSQRSMTDGCRPVTSYSTAPCEIIFGLFRSKVAHSGLVLE